MILQKIKDFFLKVFGLVPNPAQVTETKTEAAPQITEELVSKNVRKARKPRVAKPRVAKPKKIAEITEK